MKFTIYKTGIFAVLQTQTPNIFPTIAPKTSNGKNIPPGALEPKLIKVNKYLTIKKIINILIGNALSTKLIIRECPPPNKIGDVIPINPAHKNGTITLTCTGTFVNFPYISCVFNKPLLKITPVIPTTIPKIINDQ